MKSSIILIIIFFFLHCQTKAQSNWEGTGVLNNSSGISSIYTDTITDNLYVVNFNLNNHIYEIVVMRYNGVVWDTLQGKFNHVIRSITIHNNELYVGGYFRYIDDTLQVNSVAKWNGTYWENVGYGLSDDTISGLVLNLKSYNDTLYAMGHFNYSADTSVSLNSLAKWDGNNWVPVYNLPKLGVSDNSLNDLIFYEGELYVAGNFSDGVTWSDIVKYDGNNWVNVDYGIYGGLGAIVRMVVYEDELYVAGSIYKSSGNAGSFIQKWDGSQWKNVGGGVFGSSQDIYSNGQIHDMKIHNGEIYVGGVFKYAGGVPANRIAKWDGSQWCGFGGDFNNNVTALGFYHDTLFVGCGTMIDSINVNYLAHWTGGNYIDTCGVIDNTNILQQESDGVIFYPNPTTGKLTVQAEGVLEIEVLDLQGRTLINTVIASRVKQSANNEGIASFPTVVHNDEIDLSNQAKGIYIIKVKTEKRVAVEKIILE